LKAEFTVVGINPSEIYSPAGSPGTVVLRLRREVSNPHEHESYAARVDAMVKAIDESVGTSDDDRKHAKSMVLSTVKPMFEAMMPKDQPFYLSAEVSLSEEEYVALGRPAYGDRMLLEVSPYRSTKDAGRPAVRKKAVLKAGD